MKKVVNLLVAISLCGCMVTGCGSAKNSDEENVEATEIAVEEVTEIPTEEATETAVDEISAGETTVGNVSPEFKEVMDGYEDFFDQYYEFMTKYKNSNDPSGLLSEYSDYMKKYTELMEKINAIDSESLSNDDLAYYTEVMARISQKLADLT